MGLLDDAMPQRPCVETEETENEVTEAKTKRDADAVLLDDSMLERPWAETEEMEKEVTPTQNRAAALAMPETPREEQSGNQTPRKRRLKKNKNKKKTEAKKQRDH